MDNFRRDRPQNRLAPSNNICVATDHQRQAAAVGALGAPAHPAVHILAPSISGRLCELECLSRKRCGEVNQDLVHPLDGKDAIRYK
jgi:hypothetical protein